MLTGSGQIDAEQAFTHARRAGRRAAFARRLRHQPGGSLPVFDERRLRAAERVAGPQVREIPIEAITGTLEPARARLFDSEFRPAPDARRRWQRVWLAEQRGTVLPPVAVVPAGDGYVLRDGHHRVSVARARGALTIDAMVDAAPAG